MKLFDFAFLCVGHRCVMWYKSWRWQAQKPRGKKCWNCFFFSLHATPRVKRRHTAIIMHVSSVSMDGPSLVLSFTSGRSNFALYLPLRITTLIDAVRIEVIHLYVYNNNYWSALRCRPASIWSKNSSSISAGTPHVKSLVATVAILLTGKSCGRLFGQSNK